MASSASYSSAQKTMTERERDIHALCRKVYVECRDEWASVDTAAAIRALRPPPGTSDPWVEDRLAAAIAEMRDLDARGLLPRPPSGEDGDEGVQVVTENILADVDLKNITTVNVVGFGPSPRYESCTPADSNVSYRPSDPHDHVQKKAQFLPYADDPKFQKIIPEYLACYAESEDKEDTRIQARWHHLPNPDEEVVQYEAVRRLHYEHHVSLDDIDRTSIFKPLRIDNTDGLLWSISQRDLPPWPTHRRPYAQPHPGTLLDQFVIKRDDMRARVQSLARTRCRVCNVFACLTHPKPNEPLVSRKATLTNDALRLTIAASRRAPCADSCFQLMSDEAITRIGESANWSKADIGFLHTMLDLGDPDMAPCDLAVFVLRPCAEVFALRAEIITEDKVLVVDEEALEEERKKIAEIEWEDTFERIAEDGPPGGCNHPGPCSERLCSCRQNSVHCTIRCQCGPACLLQLPGCSCGEQGVRGYDCVTNTNPACPCAAAMRECDPLLCKCCKIKTYTGKVRCRNAPLQFEEPEPLEIKEGKYGLGAFATRNISDGAYIGEYVGEINDIEVVSHRGILRTHAKLNYSFQLAHVGGDARFEIDAARVGNELRYLNHSNKPNVIAKYCIVRGDIRIKFVTTQAIKKGRELYLSYGEKYEFPGEGEDEEGDSR